MAALTKAAKTARHAALYAAYSDPAVQAACIGLLADKTDHLLPLLLRLGATAGTPATRTLFAALTADPQAGLMAQAFLAAWATADTKGESDVRN